MLGLNVLGKAIRNLASALEAMAQTVNGANAALRGRLELDVHEVESDTPPALPGPDANGEAEAVGPKRNSRRRAD